MLSRRSNSASDPYIQLVLYAVITCHNIIVATHYLLMKYVVYQMCAHACTCNPVSWSTCTCTCMAALIPLVVSLPQDRLSVNHVYKFIRIIVWVVVKEDMQIREERESTKISLQHSAVSRKQQVCRKWKDTMTHSQTSIRNSFSRTGGVRKQVFKKL